MISISTILLGALIPLLGHGSSLITTRQDQPEQRIYTSSNDPVRLRITPNGEYIQATNYSDREVKAISFACITKGSNGKISVEKPIKSIESFDLKNINLAAYKKHKPTKLGQSIDGSLKNILGRGQHAVTVLTLPTVVSDLQFIQAAHVQYSFRLPQHGTPPEPGTGLLFPVHSGSTIEFVLVSNRWL